MEAAAEAERQRLETIAAIEAEQRRFQKEQQRWATEERQREAQRAEELKRLEVEREKIAAEKERPAEERNALEAARAAEVERLMAVQKECMEEPARDLDFHATVIKARQFAEATGQSKPTNRVNFIDTHPKSPAQPEWEPLLHGFKEMMTEDLPPLQRALRSQTQGNAPRSAASTSPQLRPATPQLNPPPRGAWQNQ